MYGTKSGIFKYIFKVYLRFVCFRFRRQNKIQRRLHLEVFNAYAPRLGIWLTIDVAVRATCKLCLCEIAGVNKMRKLYNGTLLYVPNSVFRGSENFRIFLFLANRLWRRKNRVVLVQVSTPICFVDQTHNISRRRRRLERTCTWYRARKESCHRTHASSSHNSRSFFASCAPPPPHHHPSAPQTRTPTRKGKHETMKTKKKCKDSLVLPTNSHKAEYSICGHYWTVSDVPKYTTRLICTPNTHCAHNRVLRVNAQ